MLFRSNIYLYITNIKDTKPVTLYKAMLDKININHINKYNSIEEYLKNKRELIRQEIMPEEKQEVIQEVMPEEKQEERGKDEKRYRPGPAEPERGGHGHQQGPDDEGPPCPIDQHVVIITGIGLKGLGERGIPHGMPH